MEPHLRLLSATHSGLTTVFPLRVLKGQNCCVSHMGILWSTQSRLAYKKSMQGTQRAKLLWALCGHTHLSSMWDKCWYSPKAYPHLPKDERPALVSLKGLCFFCTSVTKTFFLPIAVYKGAFLLWFKLFSSFLFYLFHLLAPIYF